MKCERARETVIIIIIIIIFVRIPTAGNGGGFALDISLIPGHGGLFVSRGEVRARVYACEGVVDEYKKNTHTHTSLYGTRVLYI